MTRPWYKRYPGDFIAGTVLLTFEQKGAYSMLLDLMYLRGGPIPDVSAELARILGLSVRKWNIIRKDLIATGKIYERDDHISNTRMDREHPLNEIEWEKLSENGVKGGEKSKKNKSKTVQENAENEPDDNENNTLGKKGLVEKDKPTRGDQIPDTRYQIEETTTPTPESVSTPPPNDKPPVVVFPEDKIDQPPTAPPSADELCDIPPFLLRTAEPHDLCDPPVEVVLQKRPRIEDQFDHNLPMPDHPGTPVCEAFMEALGEVYGTAHTIAYAWHGSAMVGKKWLDSGASLEVIKTAFLSGLTTLQGNGQQPPRSNWKYFEPIVSRLSDEAKAPMAEGYSFGAKAKDQGGIHPDSADSKWRARLNGYVQNDGFWMDAYGPPPIHQDCKCPPEILKEFGFGPDAEQGETE